MIHDVIDFRAVKARDVMVPMERVQTPLRRAPGCEELLERRARPGAERWPVGWRRVK